jgi:hypothetical protein
LRLQSDTCVTRYTVFDNKKKNSEKRSAQTTWHRCRVHVCLWNASCGDPECRSFVDVRAVNQHTREASTWRGGCCAMRTDALTKSGLQNHCARMVMTIGPVHHEGNGFEKKERRRREPMRGNPPGHDGRLRTPRHLWGFVRSWTCEG